MTAEIIVLRFVHVVGGIFWVGAILLNSLFIFPALMEAGPAAMGPVMAGLQRRKLMAILPVVAVLTILAGARLMSIAAAGSDGAYFQSRTGVTLVIGALAGIVSFLIGMFVGRPTGARMGQVGARMARATDVERPALAAEIAMLQRRSNVASKTVTVLLLVAAGTMAVARYLG